YSTIQKINPNVRFGVSPFGIWRNGVPPGIIGLDAYSRIYCDPLAWLEDETVDYITPQQYWPTGGGQDFETLTAWWSEQCLNAERHHIPGHGTYRLSDSPGLKKTFTLPDKLHESKYYFDDNQSKKSEITYLSGLEQDLLASTSDPVADWTLGQIGFQIDIVRTNRDKSSRGSVFFSAKDMDRVQGLAEYLAQNKYTHVTLMPEMTWKSGPDPNTPGNLRVTKIGEENYLQWDCIENQGDRYAIYTNLQQMDSSEVILNPVNLREVSFSKSFPLSELDFSNGSNIVITTVSATGRESKPTSVFKIDIDLPIVSIISPEESDTVGFNDKLVWTSDYPEALYRLEISPNINFSNLAYVSEWTGITEAMLDSLSLKGESFYYWRVRAKTDSDGPYSRSRVLFTGFPALPELIHPENLAQNVSTRPLIKWNQSPATETIKVFVSESANFETLIAEEEFDAISGEGKLSTELAKNTWFYIRLQAINSKGTSTYTDFKTFRTTSGEIPDVQLLSPADGSTVASFDELSWETTATEGTISYSLEVALDAEFKNIMSATGWISGESISIAEMMLEGQRNYYWRVKGKSEFGESEFTDPWSFIAGYPTRPSLTTPVQLSENNDVMTTIDWQTDEYTDSVKVDFSESSEFVNIEHSEKFITSQSPVQINHSLQAFTWYFARIQAINEYGGSVYSSNKYFRTGETNSIFNFNDIIREVHIYPNPGTDGKLFIKIELKNAARVEVSIYDQMGRKLQKANLCKQLNEGYNIIRMDLPENIPSGIYIMEIQSGYETKLLKLLIANK
ncbi:MAG: family 10 glycosylhydrolase, partial [Bacteroidales bacterium]